MASTTHPSRRAESVRRSLFGPVDHEQLRRELRQRLKEMSEQDSRRWNFNFQTDTPLDGRFQWEEVPPGSAAALYQESADRPGTTTTTTVCPAGTDTDTDTGTDTEDRLSAAADQENCSSISNTRPPRPAEETPVRRKRARSRSVDKSGGKCARITDFFAKRRRTTTTTTATETKCAQSAFQESGAETALCKTIR